MQDALCAAQKTLNNNMTCLETRLHFGSRPFNVRVSSLAPNSYYFSVLRVLSLVSSSLKELLRVSVRVFFLDRTTKFQFPHAIDLRETSIFIERRLSALNSTRTVIPAKTKDPVRSLLVRLKINCFFFLWGVAAFKTSAPSIYIPPSISVLRCFPPLQINLYSSHISIVTHYSRLKLGLLKYRFPAGLFSISVLIIDPCFFHFSPAHLGFLTEISFVML